MTSSEREVVAVLGGGSFGTAIASILGENGHGVRLWVRDPDTVASVNQDHENPRYFPGTELPRGVVATEDLSAALRDASLVFVAVPSGAFRDVLRQARPAVDPRALVVSCTKGIHAEGFMLMSELLHREWPGARIGVLSGPNLAREIIERKFSGAVIASDDPELCEHVQHTLSCSYFRVYDSPDTYGVELGGALKNIYAIATGMAAALGVGDNTRGLLITRSLAEMSRFASHQGGNPVSFLGLAGVGDLIVTCSSSLSRNYRLGYLVGQGHGLDQALKELGETAEGVNTVSLVAARARDLGVYMPIADGLYRILFQGEPLEQVIAGLMQGEHNHDVEFIVSGEHVQ